MMQRPKTAVEEDGVGLRKKTHMEVEVVQEGAESLKKVQMPVGVAEDGVELLQEPQEVEVVEEGVEEALTLSSSFYSRRSLCCL